MKLGIRMTICALLLITAIVMASLTLADFSPQDAPAAPEGFVLGEYEGRLAIFGAEETPLSVTDIELEGLRLADREMIAQGIPVTSQEELMALLEDLGS